MALLLESVSKNFGGFQLHPFNLEVTKGEFFCLLGPSGCGKTTVLRIIGGFEQPNSGRLFLNGKEITNLPPHKRNIHTVFQRYALFPHLNVFENVAFSLRLQKEKQSVVKERVEAMLKLVEIEELHSRKIQQLSGGQSQRVALARALITHPDVLLLDEPFSALDPALRVRMRLELKSLCKRLGVTFLMVTHDQEEALLLSDRLAVLRNGYCLQVGNPKSVYEDPTNTFVAKFIGPVNEISGEIVDNNGALFLSTPLGTFPIRNNGTKTAKNSVLLLRPEKMRILRNRSAQYENLMEGEITEISYLGSRTEYRLKIGDHFFNVYEPELERSKKKLLNPKDRIFLTWKTDDAIVLPFENHEQTQTAI